MQGEQGSSGGAGGEGAKHGERENDAGGDSKRRRFGPIPVRMLVPNVITLLSICAGLTAIRLAVEGRMELAIGAIVFAAILDGIDGRVARLIKGQSRFGAELDSLADFVNFGVAPGLILYFWLLHDINNVGWIAAMVFAISGGLRLARFNAALDDTSQPAYAANFFTGMPAPAGAITALLPVYISFLGGPVPHALVVALYILAIAGLMVSRLPVFSGKTVKMRVQPEMVLPIFVLVVAFVALLISYPWQVLTVGSIVYLMGLPFGWRHYRRLARDAAAEPPPEVDVRIDDLHTALVSPPHSPDDKGSVNHGRPERLN
jgi:CDP-diacylglycerol--serine O-phosphatidyltransferase